MVDKAVFMDMSGAKNSMHQLEIVTNNLANANTIGFRADYEVMKQHQVDAGGKETRVFGAIDGIYTDFNEGPTINTGRDLDIKITGEGFFAVQNKDGKEAYTRAGDLQIKDDGTLTTRGGELLMGIGGPINITGAEKISFGPDGTIQARFKGTPDLVTVNKVKLVNPPVKLLRKGNDGLFYLANEGTTAPFDTNVKIINGALEGSNVNTIETLTKLIELSRHYESHTNFLRTLAENSTKSNQLLEVPR